MTISVFLLDDHEIVRRGIAALLETEDDIQVVGEAGTAAQAIARIPALRPDVAILDVRLPDGEGVSVCRDVRSAVTPPPACLMLTSYLDDEALFAAIVAGASGYLLKQGRPGRGSTGPGRELPRRHAARPGSRRSRARCDSAASGRQPRRPGRGREGHVPAPAGAPAQARRVGHVLRGDPRRRAARHGLGPLRHRHADLPDRDHARLLGDQQLHAGLPTVVRRIPPATACATSKRLINQIRRRTARDDPLVCVGLSPSAWH